MAELMVGVACPACGGALSFREGEQIIACQYCQSLLQIEGDDGVHTIAFKNQVDRSRAGGTVKDWFRRGLKARDLPRTGEILECYPIYLPFWKFTGRAAGWVCGYEERHVSDGKTTRVERIPKEVMVYADHTWDELACDAGDLGLRQLENFAGETTFTEFEEIPTFDATTSRTAAEEKAKAAILDRAVRSAHVPHVTFQKVHVLARNLSLVYYPVWVARYRYRDRMYLATVDGVTGRVLSGRAPGDPLYQALAVTGGTSVGGIIAAMALAYGAQFHEQAPLIGLAIGAGIAFIAYRFFRTGSEIVQGQFKDKKGLGAQLRDLQFAARALSKGF